MSVRDETGLIEVAAGVFGKVYPQGRTNSGFVVGDDGVVVIDSLMTPSLAREVLADVARVTPKPVRYLINTHFHGDHTLGNQTFAPAPIIAHIACREQLKSDGQAAIERFSGIRPELAQELKGVEIRLPDLTFADRLTIHAGEQDIELIFLGLGHTRGDIVVHLPRQGVLFTGDLFTTHRPPAMMDAYMREWPATIDAAAGLPFGTVVPGHGYISGPEQVRELGTFLDELWTACERSFKEGRGEDETFAALRLEERYPHWVNHQAARTGVARAFRQLRGELS